jgi:hypothetical protein
MIIIMISGYTDIGTYVPISGYWHVKNSDVCVFITFELESSITCNLHVLCMLAYSNIEKISQFELESSVKKDCRVLAS